MATKPVTLPQLWASDALYTTGPFIGSIQKVDPTAGIAQKGHRPGADWPTAAEHENFQQFHITTWIRDWLFAGSSAGAQDAHIVETGSTGRTALKGLDISNTNGESGVISITNGGLLPSYFGRNEVGPVFRAITINGPGPAFRSDLAASGQGLLINNVGTGNSITLNNNTLDSTAIRITKTAPDFLASAPCVDIISGPKGIFEALKITHAAGGPAVRISSIGGSVGLYVESEDDYAFRGQTTGSNTPVIFVQASGNADGAYGILALSSFSIGGVFQGHTYGVSAKGQSANAEYGSLLLQTQTLNRPTTPEEGALCYFKQGQEAQLLIAYPGDGTTGWRGAWCSPSGYCSGVQAGTAASAVAVNPSWSTVATAVMVDGDEVPRAGTVYARCTFQIRTNAATTQTVNYRIFNANTGLAVFGPYIGPGSGTTAGYTFTTPDTAWRDTISFLAEISIGTPGPQVLRLQVSSEAGTTVFVRLASIDILGVRGE